jgi:hypothetical protein
MPPGGVAKRSDYLQVWTSLNSSDAEAGGAVEGGEIVPNAARLILMLSPASGEKYETSAVFQVEPSARTTTQIAVGCRYVELSTTI